MLFEKNKGFMLVIGMFSFIMSMILGKFAGSATIIDFLSGLFTGLSITMNLAYLIKIRLEKNTIMTHSKKIRKYRLK
ncbi:MAG: hypothetical protein ACFFCC_16015 [Promethearchaeota archaeon]